MISFFSDAGQRFVRQLNRYEFLLALDFDGTLAPITDHAHQTQIPTETLGLLKHLNRVTQIAVISGRQTKDLKPRLGFKPKYLIGNHGLEGLGDETQSKAAKQAVRTWSKQLGDLSGIENKNYSLSLHYRGAENRLKAKREIEARLKNLTPLPRIVAGKCVFNLVWPEAPHKGEALKILIAKSKAKRVLFIGDDETDEDVFRLKDRRLIGIRVGVRQASQAQFYVPRQKDVYRVLNTLAAQFSALAR